MEICAICGEQEATTRDHVPPKSIFPAPRPGNLTTVPACAGCNHGASDLDDLFKVYLSMQATSNSDLAARLFREKTVRTLERNQRLLQKLQQESTEVDVATDEGRIETRTGYLWDSVAHDSVIDRTIRGLYWHHSGVPLPNDTSLAVQWLRAVPEEVLSNISLFNEVVLGDDQVVYKYIIYAEDPRYSLWLFEFYGAHWAGGHTQPTGV